MMEKKFKFTAPLKSFILFHNRLEREFVSAKNFTINQVEQKIIQETG
jgi:hypothetical protein